MASGYPELPVANSKMLRDAESFEGFESFEVLSHVEL
jgi:hypothetical protein